MPETPTACECQARVLQLISGGIGLMNHSEAQQTVLKWWQAVMPELAKAIGPCPCERDYAITPTACECRKALESVLAHLPHDVTSQTFWDEDDGEVVYHDWFLKARAVLASPGPCAAIHAKHEAAE